MSDTLHLLPYPRHLELTGGTTTLHSGKIIVLPPILASQLIAPLEQVRQILAHSANCYWRVSTDTTHGAIGLRIAVDSNVSQAQGYRLSIEPDVITLIGHDSAGVFYGMMTLIQLLVQHDATLPCMVIDDHPDLLHRGVLLDISRDKVPTMQTLFALVDKLAWWKVNEFQLSTEHTYAYAEHPDVWASASPMTAEQYQQLDAYCAERFIKLIPNQQCFGHLHRWFELDQYLHLAEAPNGFETPWGNRRGLSFSLSPAVAESLTFVDGLLDDLLPNFSSDVFNANCDETWDVGQGRSQALVEAKGKGRVYLDFLLEIYQRVSERGKTLHFWGDIIGNHPELVPELPKDIIALEWGYEADHPFDEKSKMFAESGIPFYVCPGTSSWNTFAGRTDNMRENIRQSVENGLKHGAIGVLNTDWGDGGHPQALPVSYAGWMYGAGVGWAYEANHDIDLAPVLDKFAFQDTAGVLGQIMLDLGNAYQQAGVLVHNSSVLNTVYGVSLDEPNAYLDRAQGQAWDVGKLHSTLDYVDAVMARLSDVKSMARDADITAQELTLTATLLKHGAKRILAMLGDVTYTKDALEAELESMQPQYRQAWLLRSRVGGLNDSWKRLRGERSRYE